MKALDNLKKWWFEKTHTKCDYCGEYPDVWYEAYLFPIPEYKGNHICPKCIKKLPDQKNIVYA